jgi:HD-GYP domain-containing protein (c-di-GMP phosphodiesterase class II)
MQGPEVRDPEPPEIATAFTLQVQLDNGKQMVLQSYLPRDAPIKDYHAFADKMHLVVERQQWKSDIVGLNGALEVERRSLQAAEADFSRVEKEHVEKWQNTGRKGDPKVTPAEDAHRKNARSNIQRFRDEIAKKEKLVADLEIKLKDG